MTDDLQQQLSSAAFAKDNLVKELIDQVEEAEKIKIELRDSQKKRITSAKRIKELQARLDELQTEQQRLVGAVD